MSNSKCQFFHFRLKQNTYASLYGFSCYTLYFYIIIYPYYSARNQKFQEDVLFMSFGLGLTLLFLSACVLLPSTYVYGDYPPERALILLQTVLVAICILEGSLIVSFVMSLQKEKNQVSVLRRFIIYGLGGILFISVIIIPLLLVNSSIEKLGFYYKWSKYWDLRHENLVMASRNNLDEVHVV